MAVLCVQYKIKRDPMHPLYSALPVPVMVTRGSLVVHRYNYVSPRCRTSQYRRTLILLSVSLWNNLADPVFDGVGLAGFTISWPKLCLLPFSRLLISLSLLSFYRYCGAGVCGLIGCIFISPNLALKTFFNNNINNNNDNNLCINLRTPLQSTYYYVSRCRDWY